MKSKMKKIWMVTGICLCLLLAGTGTAWLLFSTPFQLSKTVYVYIDEDDNADSVCYKVEKAGKPHTMTGFRLMARLKKYGDSPRTGRYAIQPNTCMFDLVRHMANGIQTPVSLVVPSVRTVQRMATLLSRQLMTDSASIGKLLADSAYIASMGYTRESLPCLFIPDTYEVYWNISADKLLQRMQKEKERFWDADRLAKAQADSLTPEEIVTLASIVESETNYGPEKPDVAALYLNRLRKGMKLQSDPTVKFALQQFGLRRILFEHLTFDSPYNTYKYEGLPPGPICIPTPAGIDAVLNHSSHGYLYMCAKEDFSGSHNFAVTYAEHQQNARRYQQALNKRGIR